MSSLKVCALAAIFASCILLKYSCEKEDLHAREMGLESHIKDWNGELDRRQAELDKREKTISLKEEEHRIQEKVQAMSLEELRRRTLVIVPSLEAK